ncbi:MAG: alpha/beta hydrolase [Thermoleophilia bacterium]|nr:alpha/beta hydrolase [Thermoleophilia bacterium]
MDTHPLRLGGGGALEGRLYLPELPRDGVIVFLHGGGWSIGSVETHDRVCRRLAARTGAPVVSVEYRRAPEHPYPAAVEDATTALGAVRDAVRAYGVEPRATVMAGDSAGGTLAALVALDARGTGDAPDVLALAYASTDLSAADGSMVGNGSGFGLEAAALHWFASLWVPDGARRASPEVSPLLVDDLSGMPTTIVVTCELDPLRDQGERFAERLVAADVPVVARCEQGMVHNFLLWDLISPACAAAGDRFADDVRRAIDAVLA